MSQLTARPSRRPIARAAAAVVAILVAGLAGGAEAYWLPPGFGPNDPTRVVAFGDSITEGVVGSPCANPSCLADAPYPAVLEARLSPRHPGVSVTNEGRGGERTDDGLGRLGSVLALDQPGFVLIMEGTNDASDQAFHGVSDPRAIVDDLRAMVRAVKANRSIPILATIPPNFRTLATDAERIIEAVNAMLPDVAAAEDVRLVDVFSAMSDSGLFGPDDPLHPNQAGYDVLAAAWEPAAGQALDDSLVLLPQAYLLRFNQEMFRSGDVLQVDLTVEDLVTDAVVDVYLGLLLPPEAGPAFDCPLGDAVAFLADGFTRSVLGCLSDPRELAAPLYQDTALVAPITAVTVPDFWRAALTPAQPAGWYTLFLAITPAGDTSQALITTYHSFYFTP